MMSGGRNPAERSRRWTLGIVTWLLAVPVILAAVRLAMPSDGVSIVAPDGRNGGVVLVPAPSVRGIEPGDVLVAINGRSVDDVLHSIRPRAVRAGDRLTYTVDHEGADRSATVTVQSHPEASRLLPRPSDGLNLAVDLVLFGLGVWLMKRRPHDVAVHCVVLLGASILVSNGLPMPLLEPADLWGRPLLVGAAMANLGGYTVSGVSVLLFACAFPTPTPGFARRAWTAVAALPLAAVTAVGVAFAAGGGSVSRYNAIGFFAERLWEAAVVAGLAVLTLKWIGSRHDVLARRRIGLVELGFGLTFGLSLIGKFVPAIGSLSPSAYFVALAFFPLALVVAILKDDLFELNVVLNRGLVALVSGALLLGVYLTAVAFTVAVTGGNGPLVALPAAGVVAVAFAPLRAGVQRFIGHRLFGTASDPRLVFHRLATRLAASDDPESLMAAVVDTAAESLRLPFAAVELRAGEEWHTVEERGRRPDDVQSFEMMSGDAVVGRLVVAPRRDVRALSPSDRQLLQDLADQSGVAARVAGLLTQLRSAQQRLVVAREAERDRVHQDLHDSIGPALVGLTLQLEVAAELAGGTQLGTLVGRLHDEAARTTEDVRRLVRNLRPADLEELGLPAAVATAAARLGAPNGPRFDLETPPRLPELSKEVEDAAYKICLEAMSNAVRHSHAARCQVRLRSSTPRTLEIEVADDGDGMGTEQAPGTGLRSMHERAEAVGGWLRIETAPAAGTRILAELPSTVRP